jgi:uncharacterized membrane protein
MPNGGVEGITHYVTRRVAVGTVHPVLLGLWYTAKVLQSGEAFTVLGKLAAHKKESNRMEIIVWNSFAIWNFPKIV